MENEVLFANVGSLANEIWYACVPNLVVPLGALMISMR